MEKNSEEDKKYFDNYEENRIELEKKIKESKILNDKLINENKRIINEFDNKKELINEYESNNEKISLDEYKKRLNTSNDTYEKEIQKLKEELKKSKM